MKHTQLHAVGTTDFKALGAVDNKVGIVFNATGVGTGTGTADQISYVELAEIEGTVAPVMQ